MAKSRSVGVLTAFINADATALMREFNKVDRQVARWSQSFTKDGAKMALGFLGVQNALSAVTNELRHVVQNIESIPGVPATAVASIITMRDNLASAKNWIDQMTAGIVAFGVEAAQAIGVGFAGLFGYSDTSGLSRQETPDEIARSKDAGFDSKISQARTRFNDATKARELAGMNEVKQIIALRQEAERYETFAKGASKNTVERYEAQTKAQEKLREAESKMAALRKQVADAEKASGDAFGAVLGARKFDEPELRLNDLQQQEQATRRQLVRLMDGDQNDPANLKRQVELRAQLTRIYERQLPLLEKHKEVAKEVGATIASGFEQAVFSGGKLSDIIKGLALDLARMAFQKGITAPLASGLGGFFGKLFGGFFADGGRPPLGRVSIVGERGPELFVPDTAGTIVSNSNLTKGAGIGDSYHFHYSIAAGVTHAELMPILEAQERRTIATMQNLRRRRDG